MDETTRKDIADLNRRFFYLARQLASDEQSNLLAGMPRLAIELIKSMTLDELDALAEDMIAPCFTLKFDDATFRALVERKTTRRAYMTNILVGQSQV
jgi:hypothetical protein